jgi:hypothetical protein
MGNQNAGAIMEYDERGDLVIHIPRHLLMRHDINRIVFAMKDVLKLTDTVQTEPDWDRDPLLDLIGRFEADVSDGSLQHDLYLYR